MPPSGAAKTIHGGSAFVMPLIQDYAYLNLEPIQIEVPLRGALSAENIRVNVPSVFTVAGSVLGYVVGDWFGKRADGAAPGTSVALVPHGVVVSSTFR